jgi:hypothetical protein
MGFVNGQVCEDELIMGMTERESRSALLMLANAVESLTGDNDQNGDIGLDAVQAAIAEDAAWPAIRVVLAQTRGIAVPAPALEVVPRGNFLTDPEVPRRSPWSVHQAPASSPDLPDIIA